MPNGRELFFASGKDNTLGVIDLTGPARFLIWGPYLHLPKGEWIAKVEFEVAENFSGADIVADIHDGQALLAAATVSLPFQGIFFFELPFETTSPQQRIEVRISLMKGANEGKFHLRSVSLRLATANIQNQQLFTGSEPKIGSQSIQTISC